MAYIGPSPANQTTGARPRDEFVADGTQVTFPLTQGVPGSFETNAFIVVENIPQRPVDAFTIVDTYTISFTSGTGTFTVNETVTGGTSSATGRVIKVDVSSIIVERLTGTFNNTETFTGGTSGASKTASSIQQNYGGGLKFSEAPASGSAIYVVHQGQATYNMVPSAGSVGATQLDPNLRNFTINQFTGNGSNTQFTLSETPYSINSIVVISDGIVQTKTSNFTLSGATLSFTSAPDVGADIQVIHLGFSSGVKSVPDGSITSEKIGAGGPTWTPFGVVAVGSSNTVGGATNPVLSISSSANSYNQAYIVNKNAGSGASADLVAYPDNGTDASGWIDMGITSSSFANTAYGITGANEGYIFMSAPSGAGKTGNMVLATDSTGTQNAIRFATGGFGSGTERMRIDGSGRITTPFQPAFHAQNGNYNTSSGYITGWTSIFDRGNNFNATTGRFTAPVAGVYFFAMHSLFYNLGYASYFSLYKNGSGAAGMSTLGASYSSISGSYFGQGGGVVIQLAVNDYVEYYFTDAGSHLHGGYTYAYGYLLG